MALIFHSPPAPTPSPSTPPWVATGAIVQRAHLVEQLGLYPKAVWGVELPAWGQLTADLKAYVAPERTLSVKNLDRKWELVSAYQKSVRRGDMAWSLKLVSAMASMTDEYAYFWRRVCTTACEDIGYSNVLLMNYVVAASTLFTPKAAGDDFYPLVCFLTQKMVESSGSRMYCSLSILSSRLPLLEDSWLNAAQKGIVTYLKAKATPAPNTPREEWQVKNNWRGEGMLDYQDYVPDLVTMPASKAEPPAVAVLYGLPAYAYDMHTRLGKQALARLCSQADVQAFFNANPVPNRMQALGWALFYAEGGVITREWLDPALFSLELLAVATENKLAPVHLMELISLLRLQSVAGALDQLRLEGLQQAGY